MLLVLFPSLEPRRPKGPLACPCSCFRSTTFWANIACDRQRKHPVKPGFVPSCPCSAGDKCTLPGDTPDWWDLWAFPPEHHIQMLKSCCTHYTGCAKSGEGERSGTIKAGSTEMLGCLMPCHQVTCIQDKICSLCSTPLQGSVPRLLILFQESGVDWHCFLRLQACVLSVLSLQSPRHGAHGVECPTCAHIGKGVTLLLTLANPGRHVKGQQSVMLTRSVAEALGTGCLHHTPQDRHIRQGKSLFVYRCTLLTELLRTGVSTSMYLATLIHRGENNSFLCWKLLAVLQ